MRSLLVLHGEDEDKEEEEETCSVQHAGCRDSSGLVRGVRGVKKKKKALVRWHHAGSAMTSLLQTRRPRAPEPSLQEDVEVLRCFCVNQRASVCGMCHSWQTPSLPFPHSDVTTFTLMCGVGDRAHVAPNERKACSLHYCPLI